MNRCHPLLSVALIPALFATGCGGTADAAIDTRSERGVDPAPRSEPEPGVVEMLGTIEATVDGEARTWHVVSGSVRGEPYASAVWFESPDGNLIASLGGYDTADLPFDTFELDPARGVSLGDYRGSAATVLLMPGGGPGPYNVALSEDAPGVTYAPDATLPGIDGVFFGRTGRLNVTQLEVVGGLLRAEGTFEGTLRQLTGGGTVEVTNGRFSVQGVPPRSSLRTSPGGG